MTSSENLNPKQFGEQFGISPAEEREMTGRALGEHLWGAMENLMGGPGSYKAEMDAQALKRMRQFPAHMYGEDEDGSFVHHTSGGFTSKWHGGAYIEHIHPKHGALDVTNVTDREGNLPQSMTPEEFIQHHNDFVAHAKETYPKHYL